MGYNVSEINKDTERFLTALDGKGISAFDKLPIVRNGDKGQHGIVRRFKSLAVKRDDIDFVSWDTPNLRVETSKKAIKRGLDCAPYFAYAKKEGKDFAVMPFIKGTNLYTGAGLEKLANLGAGGVERYFNNWIGIWDCGFCIDTIGDNFLVDDEAVKFCDLECREATNVVDQRTHLYSATLALFAKPFIRGYDNEKKVIKEVCANTDQALSKFKHNGLAKNRLRAFESYIG